jgi:hypothetical protein
MRSIVALIIFAAMATSANADTYDCRHATAEQPICPREWTNLGRMRRYHNVLRGHRHHHRAPWDGQFYPARNYRPQTIVHLRMCWVPTPAGGWEQRLGGAPGSRFCAVYP